MPLYEYQCETCAHRFEVIQKFSDPPVETCPKCSGVVGKLFSSPAIQFKGSGFYITDYGRAGKTDPGSSGSSSSPSTKSESGSGSGSETKAETKTETKTETKNESKSDSKPSSS